MNLTRAFSSQAHHSFFLNRASDAFTWGQSGVLGLEGVVHGTRVSTPHRFTLKVDILAYSCGYGHTLLLTKEHTLYVWGQNYCGQLGLGDTEQRDHPVILTLPNDEKIVSVCCGAYFSTVITSEGLLYAWGLNSGGQVGGGANGDIISPFLVTLPEPVAKVTCGWDFTFAQTKSGQLWAWGSNARGELGLGHCENQLTPVPHHLEVTKIFCGSAHSIAIDRSGDSWIWGCRYCDTGLGDENDPNPTPLLEGVQDAACGWGHSLVLLKDGTLKTWGCNSNGQLGLGDTLYRKLPHTLPWPAGKNIRGIGCNHSYSYVIMGDGSLYAWGSNDEGQLGMGDQSARQTPTLLENFKWLVPDLETEEIWKLARWMFLGRRERPSAISCLPVEVLYHFVTVALLL
jgi:alpha-tubulin suppressor-like RCC1 family protein